MHILKGLGVLLYLMEHAERNGGRLYEHMKANISDIEDIMRLYNFVGSGEKVAQVIRDYSRRVYDLVMKSEWQGKNRSMFPRPTPHPSFLKISNPLPILLFPCNRFTLSSFSPPPYLLPSPSLLSLPPLLFFYTLTHPLTPFRPPQVTTRTTRLIYWASRASLTNPQHLRRR